MFIPNQPMHDLESPKSLSRFSQPIGPYAILMKEQQGCQVLLVKS